MTADSLDPLIHAPARLRIVATLAALPNGANLSFTRLQEMLELTSGNLITHLRKLEDAGYLQKTDLLPSTATAVPSGSVAGSRASWRIAWPCDLGATCRTSPFRVEETSAFYAASRSRP